MKVQAEVSLYPLRTEHLSKPIDKFINSLRQHGIEVEIGHLNTRLTGDSGAVFTGLSQAFEEAAKDYDVIIDIKISNACPGRA